ncbi:hypothetical protein E4U42_002034 [Claviceps africana]|uniref:Uncharacterized protein n=1 Tax=Claviceps africana TaxID=83212 RepID=A0A8K0NMK0_9HYPO|nr:hypothetical protein E4U42_002034 [Claviceps africana]
MGSANDLPPKKQSNKRKRGISLGETSYSAQRKVITPHNSWSSSRQRQLSLAGLTDEDEDPSQDIRHFPHRGIQHGECKFTSSEEESDPDAVKGLHAHSITSRRTKAMHRGNRLDMLLRCTHQLLDDGKVSRSAKIFGVILHLRIDGRPVDVRQHNLWALGAEIIMRTGEEDNLRKLGLQSTPSDGAGSYTHIRVPTRWGSNTNISRLRAYMEELIQRYPYDRRFPNTVSAVDFQFALFACEIFNCYAEYSAEILRLGEEQESRRSAASPRQVICGNSVGMEDERDEVTTPDRCLFRKVKEQACRRIGAIASKIDAMMENPPYSANKFFLHLQATVSLILADLLASSADDDYDDDDDTVDDRNSPRAATTQNKANVLLKRLLRPTKHSTPSLLDVSVQRMCQNQQPQQQSFHASLPIRGT